MKHLSASFAKLLTVAACVLTLGSCNRAEYAVLPKTSSPYHGVARVAAPVPVERETAAPATPAVEPAAVPTHLVTPKAAAVVAPTAPAITASAAPHKAKIASAPASAPATVVAPTPPRKLNLVQRLAAAKVGKQLRKAADLTQFKQKGAAAETQRISGNLRTGLILLLIGAILGIIPGLRLVGFIVVLIGVLFIALWLLDNL